MTKKNSENLLQKESIPLIISKENFEIFLNYLLNTLMNEDDKISKDSFYKLFPKFPYFAKKKLFEFFICQCNKKDCCYYLSLKELIQNIIKIIYANIEEKINLFANFFNFNKDNFIHYEDIRLFFYHFFLFSYQINFDILDELLEKIFINNNKLKISDFIESIKNINSDLFFLFYFLINKFFFGKTDISFFEEKIELNHNKKFNKSNVENLCNCKNLIEPTKQIFEYINQNYGFTLEYYDEEEEDYKDLNSLKVLEDDFKNCRQKIIEIADSTNFFKRQISCNIETIDNNKLFLGLSNEFQLSTTDINKLFISQKSENCSPCSTKRASLFSFEQSSRKEIFNNVIMQLNNQQIIKNCCLSFSDNYLLVKYKESENNKFFIIPLSYSFPKKNLIKDNSVFQVEINSQIFEKEKTFIFQFLKNNQRNTFYNELKRLTNYIDIKEKYNLIGQIGKGAFGQTYLSTKIKERSIYLDLQTENYKLEKFAIKVINKCKMKINNPNLTLYRNEIEISKILKETSHPNIIKIYDVLEDIDNIYIIMEYCPTNSTEPIHFNFEKKYNLIKQIIKGIQFLHGIGIIHRDIKPSNFLLGNDGYYKIIDFGFAELISPYENLNEALGSYGFFPPEMLMKKEYNLKIEYWNIGIITFYYLFNYFPFGDSKNYNDIKNFNINKFINQHGNGEKKYSVYVKKMKDIILTCLNLNVNERGCKLNYIINE